MQCVCVLLLVSSSLCFTHSGRVGEIACFHCRLGCKAEKTPAFPDKLVGNGLNKVLLDNLRQKGIESLYRIQQEAFEVITCEDSKNIFILSETSSGKTLAYSLPLLHLMIQRDGSEVISPVDRDGSEVISPVDRNGPEVISSVDRNGPRCIILLPNKLLVSQVQSVLEGVTRGLGIKVGNVYELETGRIPDVLIGTPRAILEKLELYEANFRLDVFGGVDFVVVDEADLLLERMYREVGNLRTRTK